MDSCPLRNKMYLDHKGKLLCWYLTDIAFSFTVILSDFLIISVKSVWAFEALGLLHFYVYFYVKPGIPDSGQC